MNTADVLVQSILQKQSLADCSVEELQALAHQYPYFSAAQLLLAEKLKTAEPARYNDQVQRASLHFTNPLWLDLLLNNGVAPTFNLQNSFIAEPEPRTLHKTEDELPQFDHNVASADNLEDSFISESESERAHIKEDEVPDFDPGVAPTVNPQDSFIATSEPETAHKGEVELPQSDRHIVENTGSELPADAATETEATETVVSKANAEKVTATTDISFEPYHTVDYFASQGIRFVADEKPRDRFGQQLKSFTEWLKTMKRLPETDALKMNSPVADEKVQQLADHSIAEKDVFTETMAEVWLKQGNREKAIEIYGKLGLLNPGKSAYFASLIEQIKNS